MKRFLERSRHGEKGFTLVELLIVVAIIGVLAAVIIPNIGKFMGRGTLEAANTEATMVQTAVASAMMDAGTSTLKVDLAAAPPIVPTVGPGRDSAVTAGDGTTPVNVIDYVSGSLEAVYTLSASGTISGANGAGGKWKDLLWDTVKAQWYKP